MASKLIWRFLKNDVIIFICIRLGNLSAAFPLPLCFTVFLNHLLSSPVSVLLRHLLSYLPLFLCLFVFLLHILSFIAFAFFLSFTLFLSLILSFTPLTPF